VAAPHTRGEKVGSNQYRANFARPAEKRSLLGSIAAVFGLVIWKVRQSDR